MQVEDIRTLIEAMNKNGLSLLEWENEGSRLRLEKPAANAAQGAFSGQTVNLPAEADPAENDVAAEPEPEGELVTAPVVGIFYAAPSPDSDPFVKTGSAVEAGATLCIIEAMKLMNEVTCPKAGIVREILVQDGQKVEFGQPLMRIGGADDVV